MVRLVPHELREAALALGVTALAHDGFGGRAHRDQRYRHRRHPRGRPRRWRDRAAAVYRLWQSLLVPRLAEPIASLTVQVYTYAISPFADWQRQAWAGALVLTAIVLALELGVRWITRGRLKPLR